MSTGAYLTVSVASCGVMMTQNFTFQNTNITANFTVCGTNPTGLDTVAGTVNIISNNVPNGQAYPAYPAVVYLIEKSVDTANNSFILTLVDSMLTNANGEYAFAYIPTATNGVAADVLVKAALLPTNNVYNSYLPTYYVSNLNWSNASNANFLPLTTDISLIAGINPGGPGFIGGSVLQGANKTTNVGDPLNKRLLLLTNMSNQPVGYTYSNASGAFSFSNLPLGIYKLFGDAWGKQNPVLLVNITASNSNITNIVFEENATQFMGHFNANAVGDINDFSGVQVFPNPISTNLNVIGLYNEKGNKKLSIYDLNGLLIMEQTVSDNEVVIPFNSFASGNYFLHIKTDHSSKVYQLVK
jgi:hypothetical protein